ncbi:MAG TPA: exodeoxyribonuclease VII large subunit [Pyrinomonadaceae bacterium]|jgi:hypothetical protein|nr:exodeoxyribonuclease VII large subunit [Pyrinomonadaceae bacterium]
MTNHDKPHTPYELAHTLFSACKHEVEQQTVRIRGQYRSGQGVLYSGYYYDYLRDEREDCSLVIKVPKVLRLQLIDRTPYELEGRIEKGLIRNKELGIHLYFTLVDVVGRRDPIIDSRVQEKADILQSHLSKPRQDVDLLLRNLFEDRKRPLVAMVFGRSAATETDIMWAVGNRQDRYEFAKFPINLADKKAIIDKLRELDKARGYDLMVLYRGGGSGLEIFDDPDIARVVVGMKTPFVTAIGHAIDVPFLQQVADRAFTTPTDFGKFLKETADKYIREASQLRKYRQQEKEHLQKIEDLRAEKDHFQEETLQMSRAQQEQMPIQIIAAFRRRLILWLLAAVVCGAGIGVAVSYVYLRLLSHGVTAAGGAREGSVSNEQVPPNPVPTSTSNSPNVDRKKRAGK